MSIYCHTDVGKRKERNEDCVRCTTLPATAYDLIAVADGMGGHPDGDVVSGLAIETLATTLEAIDNLEEAPATHLRSAYHDAHNDIKEYASDINGDPGTTLVAALLDSEEAIIANVGDSRAYRVANGIDQLTTDQSHVQQLVDAGELNPAEADDHPMSHVLAQALGTADDLSVDIERTSLDDGWLLVCSDGLSDPVEEATIEQTCRDADSLSDAGSALVKHALDAGAPDNVSVALYRPDG